MRISRKLGLYGLMRKTLFKNGTDNTELTGGWVTQAIKPNPNSGNATKPTVTWNTDSVTVMQSPSYRTGVLRTVNAIDLTPYSKLRVQRTVTKGDDGYVYFQTWEKDAAAKANTIQDCLVTSNSGVVTDSNLRYATSDISNVTGEHYICIYVASGTANASTTVYNIYLER